MEKSEAQYRKLQDWVNQALHSVPSRMLPSSVFSDGMRGVFGYTVSPSVSGIRWDVWVSGVHEPLISQKGVRLPSEVWEPELWEGFVKFFPAVRTSRPLRELCREMRLRSVDDLFTRGLALARALDSRAFSEKKSFGFAREYTIRCYSQDIPYSVIESMIGGS